MKPLLTISIILLLGGSLATTSWAQQRGNKKGKQIYSRTYNMNTVQTIEGEVVEVSYTPSKKNAQMMGIHVVVRTDSESIPVHLGPAWYLKEQEMINKGDRIVVTGSRITFNGSPAVIAETVKRQQMTLRLRDQNGFPVWRGWRMNNNMNRRQ